MGAGAAVAGPSSRGGARKHVGSLGSGSGRQGAIERDISALTGKQVSGEAVMYHFESVTLNGQKQNNAYIADDEQKTGSLQCMLAAPTKLKANTKVSFKGTLKTANWIERCEIAEKK